MRYRLLLFGVLIAVGWMALAMKTNDNPKISPKNKRLKILLISDLNASYGSLSYSDDVPAVLGEIGRIKPDLILCAGDMVAGQKTGLSESHLKEMWKHFKTTVLQPIQSAKIPFGFTLGNHDASPNFKLDRAVANSFWQAEKDEIALQYVDASHYPFYFSYVQQGVFFISWDASGAKISQELYQWLEAQCKLPVARKASARILLGHLPLYAIVAAKNKVGEVNSNPDSALAAFSRSGIDMYISGHQHAYFPGKKGALTLLNAACIGDGPRALLNHSEPAKKGYTLVEIPLKKGNEMSIRTFMPKSNVEISLQSLPDHISGFNGTLSRIP